MAKRRMPARAQAMLLRHPWTLAVLSGVFVAMIVVLAADVGWDPAAVVGGGRRHAPLWLVAGIGLPFFGTGVVVGETCRIGHHVKLYHGVTLGARSFAKDESGHIVKGGKRHPDVEDNVTIYPNSTILGGETVVGKESTIGANVFLMHSVPAQSLVVYEEKQLVIRNKKERHTKPDFEWSI